MRILNLYAGIGGNRKLWPITEQDEVVAIELDPEIAKIYQSFFPKDKVIVTDAHQYLLEHFEDFDFIWSSPPCPSHSRIRKVFNNQNSPIYPDLKLYEEILFLEGYFKGMWVVENVLSWYDPLIKPYIYRNHYYWSNFIIDGKEDAFRGHYIKIEKLQKIKGFNLDNFKGIDKKKILRNCVEPEAGLHIFNMAFKNKQLKIFDLGSDI